MFLCVVSIETKLMKLYLTVFGCVLLHFTASFPFLFYTIHVILPLKELVSPHGLTNSSAICLPHFLSKGHSNRQRLFRRYTTRKYRYPASPTAPAIWPMWMLTNLMHDRWWWLPQITPSPLRPHKESKYKGCCLLRCLMPEGFNWAV